MQDMGNVVYCIPGLGNDERVFSYLNIEATVKYINFIEPKSVDESVQSYCLRLLEQIDEEDRDASPILLGFSLGGILAIELSKLIDTSKVIIINSIKSAKERPVHMNLMNALPAYRLIPQFFTKIAMIPMMPLFGFLPPDQEDMYKDMWEKSSNKFIRWGAQTVINWEHTEPVPNIVHIHGDGDLVFPVSKIKSPYIIKKGTHVMITRLHKEVSDMINGALSSEEFVQVA